MVTGGAISGLRAQTLPLNEFTSLFGDFAHVAFLAIDHIDRN